MPVKLKQISYPSENMDEYPYWVSFATYSISVGTHKGSYASKVASESSQVTSPAPVPGEPIQTRGVGEDFLESLGNLISNNGPVETGKSNLNISTSRTGESVKLYLPQAIQSALGVNYDRQDLDISGKVLEHELKTGASGIKAALNTAKEGMSSVLDAFRKSATEEAGKLAMVRLANNMDGWISGAVRSATRVATNPNTLALFKSVSLREFSFSFKMIPTSEAEAANITKIIYFFRKNMMPTGITVGGIPMGYNFPDQFHIKMYKDLGTGKTKPLGHQIKPCYLYNVNVTYNASSMGMHRDGNFTETDLTLSFVEAETLTKSDITKGY